MNTAQTPAHIVSAVVYCFIGIAAVFTLTLAICILTGRAIPETLGAHFANLGSMALGLLGGLLVNTKSNPVIPTSSETVTTTREVTEPPESTEPKP